jgi:hypothetical protein
VRFDKVLSGTVFTQGASSPRATARQVGDNKMLASLTGRLRHVSCWLPRAA